MHVPSLTDTGNQPIEIVAYRSTENTILSEIFRLYGPLIEGVEKRIHHFTQKQRSSSIVTRYFPVKMFVAMH